ncbi:unnamed protein product [Closterium sp. NIES-53]
MVSWKSTGTYVNEVPPPGANIVSGMWIFRVKRPSGSPPVFKARYVARGFSQQQGVDFFLTFSPTPKMTTLRVLLHVAAQRDYELHSLHISTAFLQGSLHKEIWLRRPPGFTGTTLTALGFAPSTADPSLFLRTDTTLPPFYVLMYEDDLVFATANTEALAHVKSELQKRHTCTDLGGLTSYLGLRITRDRSQRTITLTQSHMVQQVLQRFGFTYSSPQSTPLPTGHSLSAPPSDESTQEGAHGCSYEGAVRRAWGSCLEDGLELSSLVMQTLPGSSCEAEIYAGAMAAQELRWLTYLLTNLGEAPRSPPVLYQRGQLHLANLATRANTDNIFTKALQPCDHQRFCTMLACFVFLDQSCDLLFSPTLHMGYVAATDAGKEGRRLRFLLAEFKLFGIGKPTILRVDIKLAITVAEGLGLTDNLKHMEQRYAWLQHMVRRGMFVLKYIQTTEQPADFLTKALHFPAFNWCSVVIGQVRLVDVGDGDDDVQ